MSKVQVVSHPFVQDSLAHLRDSKTELQKFRHHSDKICQLLFYEALRSTSTREEDVLTPLALAPSHKLSEEIVIVPILRAGLAMLQGALHFLPKSKVGFVGLERDEETAIARRYYWKLPKITSSTVVVITDPMLATGGSISHVLQEVIAKKPRKVIVVCVIAAPEGVALVNKDFPQVEIFTASLDERLNEKKYIVPGLGDYGDRYFGTT